MNQIAISNPGRRWLLVDDNRELLAMLAGITERFTDATIECHDSPHSALAAFAAAPDAYELVITDFEMPGMDGVDLCRKLRFLAPHQKVMLATGSGYFSEVAAAHAGFAALLNKPFPLASLQKALALAGIESGTLAHN